MSLGHQPSRRGQGLRLLLTIGLTCFGTGCISTLKEEYYLKAFSQDDEVTNYFRIRVTGEIWLSKAKYSVGFYDRSAVETLFGERSLRQEYLISQANFLDGQTQEQLAQLNQSLAAARTELANTRRENLLRALGASSGILDRYRIRLAGNTPNANALFDESLTKAAAAIAAATAALEPSSLDLAAAASKLETVQVILETIRITVEGQLLVHFFDGAGNELPVRDKTLVIFVATDVSRFAQALGQLAESAQAKQDLLLAILGPRLREAERLAQLVKTSDSDEKALADRLATIVKDVENEKGDALAGTILEAATATSGRGSRFSTAAEIRGYASGIGNRQ